MFVHAYSSCWFSHSFSLISFSGPIQPKQSTPINQPQSTPTIDFKLAHLAAQHKDPERPSEPPRVPYVLALVALLKDNRQSVRDAAVTALATMRGEVG